MKTKKSGALAREPNGRLSRTVMQSVDACSPAEVRRLRDAALAGMRDEQWGTEAGRLFLTGKLTGAQFEAAKRWMRLSALASAAMRGPARAKRATSFVPRDGGQEPDPDTEAGKAIASREADVLDDFKAAHKALVNAGMLSERAVRQVCEENLAPEGQFGFDQLTCGLNALGHFWGLTQALGNVRQSR